GGDDATMHPSPQVTFGHFRFDITNEQLWHGSRVVPLRPKPFAVLRYLVQHPGQLVTKQELLEAVWPSTFVGGAVLKESIRQVREALSDTVAAPRSIETAHRRGYRFIGLLGAQPPGVELPRSLPSRPGVLGRERESAILRGWLERSLRGKRQVVFVTGEPGIGKTTLVNA